jgi:predicted lipoprotein with Yx(FWY)xxD motif
LFAGGVLTAALASACGSGGGYGSSSAATAPANPAASADATSPATGVGAGGYQAPPPPAVAAVAVGLRKSAVGTFLVDGSGRTLYLFEADKANASSCTSTCTQAWPPLTTMAAATAGQGVNSALLGVVKRSDGTSQVSYGGHPLYFYADDTAAGQVHGQGVTEFGAKWYVVSSAGQKIDKD